MYQKAVWIRDMEADIVNIKTNIVGPVSHASILKAVNCSPQNVEAMDLPYGIKVYHDRDGTRRENAIAKKINFHAFPDLDIEMGGNILFIGEENGRRIGLSERQLEVMKDKKQVTVEYLGTVARPNTPS